MGNVNSSVLTVPLVSIWTKIKVREKDKSGYINDNKNCVTFSKLNVNGESFLGNGKTYVISLRDQQEQKDSKAKFSCQSVCREGFLFLPCNN